MKKWSRPCRVNLRSCNCEPPFNPMGVHAGDSARRWIESEEVERLIEEEIAERTPLSDSEILSQACLQSPVLTKGVLTNMSSIVEA
ncbi:MAG: hypothetical protein ACFCU2_11700, partial [Acidimicrobiia bacterium]